MWGYDTKSSRRRRASGEGESSRGRARLAVAAAVVAASLMLPGVALAATEINIGHDYYTEAASGVGENGGTWSWDGADELVLCDYDGREIGALGRLSVVLVGRNTVEAGYASRGWMIPAGISNASGSLYDGGIDDASGLTITGGGSLTVVNLPDATTIGILGNGTDVTIDGATVVVTTANGDEGDDGQVLQEGISAWGGGVSVVNGAEVSIQVGHVRLDRPAEGISATRRGGYAATSRQGVVTIAGSSVDVMSANGYAIVGKSADPNGAAVDIRDSVVRARGAGHAIFGEGAISLANSDVVAEAAPAAGEPGAGASWGAAVAAADGIRTRDMDLAGAVVAVDEDGVSYVANADGSTESVTLRHAGATSDSGKDGWVPLPGGGKGYRKNGKLVTGWLDIGDMKYWFHEDGTMARGWTDVEVDGKVMHYYFNPASGNLVRGTWFEIDGYKYYFRPSGNVAHGWATISDNGVDKKYYFDDDYHLVTGWRDIDTGQGYVAHYYFRPSGSMATGWADIDGHKYYFRSSGNMATGFTTVEDGHKRYFDADGHMLLGWQAIDGKTFHFRDSGAMDTGWKDIDGSRYYFRPSGVMQTGTATIDGVEYAFGDDGALVG